LNHAQRIAKLPPYLFAEIDKKIEAKRAAGVDVISLGIGDPDLPTPPHVVRRLKEAAEDPKNHRYPSYYGMRAFREAIAAWYRRRFGVELDPDTEVLPLIGSKEGIAHIYVAFVDPGDVALVPDPGYPVYQTGALLAGGITHAIPLLEENDFLPDLEAIPRETARAAKLMFLNYPNNPTAATATPEFLERAADYCRENEIVLCHDFAYSEITYDGYRAPSLLEMPGGREAGVEFHSLSKTYNMTGWRIGFVVGNASVIEALGRVKTNIDSGIFNAVQYAGIEALSGPQDCVREVCEVYRRRRDRIVERLRALGWPARKPLGSIYIWVRVPEGHTSTSFATHLLEEAGVVVSPGNAYGPSGEGFIRFSLTLDDERIDEALDRIERVTASVPAQG